MKVQRKSIVLGSNRSARQRNRLAFCLSILTGLLVTAYSPAAMSADAQATDPSVKQDKEPFAVDKTPPDMVVDERTEMEMLRDQIGRAHV